MILRLFSGLSASDVPHPSLNDDQKLDWLRLIRSQNVGPVAFRFLINQFGGAKAALEALPDLAKRGGARGGGKIYSLEDAEKELSLAAKTGLQLLAMGEGQYPGLLGEIDQAPPLIYVKGNPEVLTKPMIAVVGSRNSSVVGRRMAHEMATSFSKEGFVTVSGLARGIDGAAHEGALEGGTIAVLAGGLNAIYPAQHIPLAEAIVSNGGALISETHPGYKPRGQDFPRRNRIISGVSLGTVVIEAAIRSGSLITARMAGEQNRILFAVPGSPLDPRAEGGNKLIREGAVLARNGEDVMSELRPMMGRADQQQFRFDDEIGSDVEIFDGPLPEPSIDERESLVPIDVCQSD